MSEKDPRDEEEFNKKNESDDDDFGLPGMDDENDEYTSEDSHESDEGSEELKQETSTDEVSDQEDEPFNKEEWEDVPMHKSRSDFATGGSTIDEDTTPRKAPIGLIIILVVVLAAAAAVLYYLFGEEWGLKSSKTEQIVLVDTTSNKVDSAMLMKDTVQIEELQVITPTSEILSERTGRYYVIVASFLDGDLANDYADKLLMEGVSSKILSPKAEKGFYRFSVADYERMVEAEAEASNLRSIYGEGVWVAKY